MLLAILGSVGPGVRADTASEIRALTGAHSRIAWLQIVPGRRRSRKVYRLVGLDTEDGQGIRRLWSSSSVGAKPLITPSGARVVFSNRSDNEVYILNWDGSGLHKIVSGYATDVWKDPSDGVEWVYVRTGDGRMKNSIRRYQIDHPQMGEMIWNKTPLDAQDFSWFQVTADGKHAGAAFPWPNCGIASLPNGALQLLGSGCWPSIAPDGARFFHFDGSHKHALIYDINGANRRAITLNNAPGINGNTVFFPRWTKDGRFITMTGPSFMNQAEVYIGKLNTALTGVEKWVQVSRNHIPDNWGDLWVASGLGQYSGKAPLAIRIPGDRSGSDWIWDYGDGVQETARAGSHTYARPGAYTIRARRERTVLKGRVSVLPPVRPRATLVKLLDDTHILVNFSEQIQLRAPQVSLEGQGAVKGLALDPQKYYLVIALKERFTGTDWLRLDGIYDRAQVPNAIENVRLPVVRPPWPASFDGLGLLWENGNQANLLYNPEAGATLAFAAEKEGLARLDRNGAMLLNGGSFHSISADFQDILLRGMRKTRNVSLEATIQPTSLREGGPGSPAMIVYYGFNTDKSPITGKPTYDPTHQSNCNFWLGQKGDRLLCNIRTTRSGIDNPRGGVELCRLPDTRPHHLLLTYQPGHLVCYMDGKRVQDTARIKGDPNWIQIPLSFGLDGVDPFSLEILSRRPPWRGRLEGFAMYSRFIGAPEAVAEGAAYSARMFARKVVPQIELQARLVAKTTVPRVSQIAPYRSALLVYEYEVRKTLSGHYRMPRIRVAQWGLLDRRPTPIAQERVGRTYHLVLEPFADHPELESELLRDTLPENFDLSLYVAVGA